MFIGGYSMRHIKWKNICLMMCAFVFSATLFADQIELEDSMLVAQQSKSKKNNRNNTNRNPNVWKPYFQSTKLTEPITSFFQQTAGIGFLYFSGIDGNLNPTTGLGGGAPKVNKKLTGHIGYNRTPVIESIIGRDIWYWFKLALSYTHQGGVVFQTRPQNFSNTAGFAPDLTAHVRLDAAMLRLYFMSPATMVWKNCYYNPYLSVGVGPGWITLCDIKSFEFTNALRMKVSPNCVFTIDLGMKFRKAMPTYVMSFTMGCKYTEWGQILNVGKSSQQYASSAVGGVRQALNNPLRVNVLYQFAPYIGVQFNF